jgi:hypothetical protein
MVERVAQATWEEWRTLDIAAPSCRDLPFDELLRLAALPDGKPAAQILSAARSQARVAIAAMREPTEAMLEAANREWDGRMSFRSTGAWRAMIDAALAVPKP